MIHHKLRDSAGNRTPDLLVATAGMWTTRQMTHTHDREIVVRTTLRELVVYIVFLIILCIRKYPNNYHSFTYMAACVYLDTNKQHILSSVFHGQSSTKAAERLKPRKISSAA